MNPYAVGGLAAFQVWSGYQQAEMVRASARLNDRVAQLNKQYADIDAWNAEKQGYTQSSRYQSVIDATVSEQRNAFAAQGVDVNYGTAAEVQKETRVTGFLNQLDIMNQARMKATGIRQQGRGFILNAAMQDAQAAGQASSAITQGYGNAAFTGASMYSRTGLPVKNDGTSNETGLYSANDYSPNKSNTSYASNYNEDIYSRRG